MERGRPLRWRLPLLGLRLLDVNLASTSDQFDGDLVARYFALSRAFGRDGASPEVDSDLEMSLTAVFLNLALILEARTIG